MKRTINDVTNNSCAAKGQDTKRGDALWMCDLQGMIGASPLYGGIQIKNICMPPAEQLAAADFGSCAV